MKTSENSRSNTGRRDFIRQASTGSLGIGLTGAFSNYGPVTANGENQSHSTQKSGIKITDIRAAVIANSPVVCITTDAGISGYGQIESTKPYLKPHILFYKDYLLGEDPTNVERCMMKIRRMGKAHLSKEDKKFFD